MWGCFHSTSICLWVGSAEGEAGLISTGWGGVGVGNASPVCPGPLSPSKDSSDLINAHLKIYPHAIAVGHRLHILKDRIGEARLLWEGQTSKIPFRSAACVA